MIVCPHCHKSNVSAWKKYCASITDPFVCGLCEKPSSIPSIVESISALVYGFAIFIGLNVFAFSVIGYARTGEVRGPAPGTIIICLLLFYLVFEAAKVYWVPLTALTDSYVARREAKSNRWMATGAIIVILAVLLERCGF